MFTKDRILISLIADTHLEKYIIILILMATFHVLTKIIN